MKIKPLYQITAISCLATLLLTFLIYTPLYSVGSRLSAKFGQPLRYFPDTILEAVSNHLKQPVKKINFIILGTDKRDDSFEKNEMTDTIIFASFDTASKRISLVSLPRDLWYEPTQSKINAFYENSKESNSSADFDQIKGHYSDLTGQKVDRLLVIDTNDLVDFVNLIGGVDVYLESGFVDQQYPNPEYIENPSPQIPIYKTIEFPPGYSHLDSTNITEFVRSRKGSDDPQTGGTDLGRIQRQQLLINAIIAKLSSGQLNDLDNITSLYQFFHHNLETDITDLDLFQIILAINGQFNQVKLEKFEIPISATYSKSALIYHPNRFKNNQWVFLPADPSLDQLHQFMTDSLKNDN